MTHRRGLEETKPGFANNYVFKTINNINSVINAKINLFEDFPIRLKNNNKNKKWKW